ncbi:hypothetical protein EV361DRAFT_646281 [Lentinula raphanica]|uniref:Ubiquitin-like protease family profile domain-containing protein n=1 Tax=Lentinula raphanica TaxID=153919 RepID=A0AA38NYY0_9AGAR|nr:hypothetical protein F5878DRAFT_419208 [Lentinula raphanica]KAJ3965526.1 hypothetical protein EV361DRAFT_646281 [Lentinula raphanica]
MSKSSGETRFEFLGFCVYSYQRKLQPLVLCERYLANRQKPLDSQENTGLMLVLMPLTEILSELRGDPVKLKDDEKTNWVCKPHSKVHFHRNLYDCGVHTLWHLQHCLEFRRVRLGDDCPLDAFRLTDNMVGKRMRLAQEILKDCNEVDEV